MNRTIKRPCSGTAGWPLHLLTLAGLVTVAAYGPIYHGVFRHYLANPDQDMDLAYHALVLASGQPAEYFEHTGFTYILLYSWFLRLGHFLGLIGSIDIDAIVKSPAVEFDRAFSQVVFTGRCMSVLFAMATVVVTWAIALRATSNRFAALAGAALVAGSLGLGLHAVLIHTELLGMLLLLVALLAVIEAARCGGTWRAVAMIAGASFFVMLAVMTKFHLIMLTPIMPFLALFYGAGSTRPPPSARGAGVFVLVAIAAAFPAIVDAIAIIAAQSRGGYQILFALAVIGATVTFARVHRIDHFWLPPVWAAILLGLSTGYYANLIAPQPWTPWATFNFFEAGLALAGPGIADQGGLPTRIVREALAIMHQFSPADAIARRYGLVLVYWLDLAGIVALFLLGCRRQAVMVGILVGLSIGLRFFHNLHGYGLRHYYLLLVEPWAIFGFIHLVAALDRMAPRPIWGAVRAATVLLCLAVILPQIRLVIMAPTTGYTQPPSYACDAWKSRVARIEPQIARFCGAPPPFPNYYRARP